ncbi:MAG: ABC transporter permease [Myxococcales bacterium]|nr:MAG: ABC transporter permease [Myxococcales bacterium]
MSVIADWGRAGFDGAIARSRQGIETTGQLTVLAIDTIKALVTDIARGRFSWEEFILQCSFMVRVSLLPTILVSIPFGVIISVQIGAVAAQIGATSFTGAVNGAGVLQQGAPLVTSLLIAGAVGSAITSDLGARTVREEIDALKVMGISPVQRLVAPRLLAALLVSLLLTVVVAMTAMVTAYLMNVGPGTVSSGAYIGSFISFSNPMDLVVAEGKALVFGFLATIVCCHKGLTAKGGPKGVADAVNQAVVLSVIFLAVANVFITQAYVMLIPQRIT